VLAFVTEQSERPPREAHQKDLERLLQISRELAPQEPKPSAAEVFAILIVPKIAEHEVASGFASTRKDADGKLVAALTMDRKGMVLLSESGAIRFKSASACSQLDWSSISRLAHTWIGKYPMPSMS
jgi:hypothetical protein